MASTTLDPNFKLDPSPADKAAAATDTNVGSPVLTPAERDAKPSTDLKIVGSTADFNQNNNRDKSNVHDLNLKGHESLNPDFKKAVPKTSPKLSGKKEDAPKPADPIIFQTAIGDKVPDALTNMMLMSKAVHEDSINVDNSDPANPKTYIPRISSALTTDPNTKEQTVTYFIERVAKPMRPAQNGSGTGTDGAGNGQGTGGTGGTSPEQGTENPQSNKAANDASVLPDTLEYDYIYTGKNVDVLQFDMNVKLGLNSLKAITVVHPTASNSNKDITPDNETTTGKKPNSNAGEARDTATSRVQANNTLDDDKNDHVSPPVTDPGRIGSGSLSPETLFAARKNLSEQVSVMLSKNPSVLKLVGNPLLLAGYVMPSDTYDGASQESVQNKKEDHKNKTGVDSGGMLKVRVNIRSPKPSYMQGAKLGDDDNFYSSPFWLDKNYFFVQKITHKFTKGEFVQFLELRSQGDQSNTTPGQIGAKRPPSTTTKPAESAINETKGANVKAFLDMISHAEGTYGKGDNGYNVRWGGVIFEGYATHPWKVKPWASKDGAPHTPAGRYQIIVGTFDSNKASCGGDFSPGSQDRIAVAIMKSVRGAYSDVVKGDPKTAINKLKSTTWTGLQGFSEATLLKWYEQHGGTYKPQTSDELPSSGTGATSKDYGPSVKTNGTGVKPGKQKDFMDKNWNAANIAAEKLGTDPKILLAQSAEETGWGKNTTKDKNTGQDSNNMFNIKADKNWHGPTVTANVPEYDAHGNKYYVDQKFRAYSTPEESYADYVDFLNSNKRYNTITKNPTKDPMEYFGRLKQAHYATAPNYATALTGMYNGSSIKNYKPK